MKAGPRSWAPGFYSFAEQMDRVLVLVSQKAQDSWAVTVLGSCYGLHRVPPDSYVEVPVPQNMIICGDRVFIEVI